MSLRPTAFPTPYEVIRPISFESISTQTPAGESNSNGVLQAGEIVWTHPVLPQIQGHHLALGFVDTLGEVLIDVTALRPAIATLSPPALPTYAMVPAQASVPDASRLRPL